jgi:hypothetical protein
MGPQDDQKMENKIHYFKCENSITPKLGSNIHNWGAQSQTFLKLSPPWVYIMFGKVCNHCLNVFFSETGTADLACASHSKI